MSDSARPPMQSVLKSLIVGVIIGLLIGLILGIGGAALYVQQNPPVYQGGAYPSEMTNAYQKHYMAMVVDSYIVNGDSKIAQERLKTFGPQPQILVLGERSAAYVAAGRGPEAQMINKLALELKDDEDWTEDQIKAVVTDLTGKYQTDPAKAQAIGTFSAELLNGQVPVPVGEVPQGDPSAEQAGEAAHPAAPPPASPAQEPGRPWPTYLACCLLLLGVLVIVYLIGRRQFEKRKAPTKQKIDWEGEGVPPFRMWSGTYKIGPNNYEEFTTLETDDDVFLGECGVEGRDSVPGSTPKQFMGFDVGLFDKTDITTLSNMILSEHAYNDESIRSKYEGKAKTEVILAEPGKRFLFETSALRVEAKIAEMEYGDGGNVYFDKLKVELTLFLQEGADLKKGTMDIPDQYQ